ncbi:hypothetical protein JW960_12230 [candidate division KSB1 bacterium]|nr:hypothetical protein [candidate division KSB1 bacterium]
MKPKSQRQTCINRLLNLIVLFALVSLQSCATSQLLKKEKTVKFPPTTKVDLLLVKPQEPYVAITTIESRGDLKSNLKDLFSNMKVKGQEVGADAIIPTRDLESGNQKTFEAYIVSYQEISGTKVPILRGQAIKYRSTIQKLKQQGVEVEFVSQSLYLGVQTDIVSTAFSGFSMSAWAGRNDYRIRLGWKRLHVPDFFLAYDYQDGRLDSDFNFSGDYFFSPRFKGMYVSGGTHFWSGSLAHKDEVDTGNFSAFVVSLGMGYSRPLVKGIYLNSLVEGQFLVGGDASVDVGTRTAYFYRVVPVVSVEIGWQY